MADETKALYDQIEQGWRDLIAAAQKINDAVALLKKTDQSIDGYNIERAMIKHKPHLFNEHLENLLAHRKENKL